MKKLLVAFMLTVANGNVSLAQTNFYTNVTNLWYQGYKTDVLEIAEQRLNVNSNDIAGLILKAEYDLAFLELATISNSFQRVIQIGDTITSTNFVKRFEVERENLLELLDVFKNEPIPMNELPVEKAKANIIHKPLPTKLIEALQKDGYFD